MQSGVTEEKCYSRLLPTAAAPAPKEETLFLSRLNIFPLAKYFGRQLWLWNVSPALPTTTTLHPRAQFKRRQWNKEGAKQLCIRKMNRRCWGWRMAEKWGDRRKHIATAPPSLPDNHTILCPSFISLIRNYQHLPYCGFYLFVYCLSPPPPH